MEKKFLSRKFIVTMVTLLGATAGMMIGKVLSPDYATVAGACVLGYSFANAATYFKPAHNSDAG